MTKNILVLAENLDIQISSSSKCISKLINALSDTDDFKVDVVAPASFGNKHDWLTNTELIVLDPFVQTADDKMSFFDKVQTQFTGFASFEKHRIAIWRKGILEALSRKRYDAILLLASGADFYTHHVISTFTTEVPIIAYYHDPYPWLFYPESYRITSGKRVQKAKARSLQRAFDLSVAHLFPSQRLEGLYKQYYTFDKSQSHIVPHLLKRLSTIYRWESGHSFSINPSEFHITHAGALHPARHPETLLNAFAQFSGELDTKEAIFLNIIGPESKMSAEATAIIKKVPNTIRFFGRVGYLESIAFLEESSVNIILESDTADSPFLPGKFPDYVMANKPIVHIGPKASEVADLLGENAPEQVAHGDVAALIAIFKELYLRWQEDRKQSLQRPDLEAYLSPERFVQTMNTILK